MVIFYGNYFFHTPILTDLIYLFYIFKIKNFCDTNGMKKKICSYNDT